MKSSEKGRRDGLNLVNNIICNLMQCCNISQDLLGVCVMNHTSSFSSVLVKRTKLEPFLFLLMLISCGSHFYLGGAQKLIRFDVHPKKYFLFYENNFKKCCRRAKNPITNLFSRSAQVCDGQMKLMTTKWFISLSEEENP